MSDQPQAVPTRAEIVEAFDSAWTDIAAKLALLSDPLSTTPDTDGWAVRQLLSHLAGSFQRIPIQAGFFLSDIPAGIVPVTPGEPFWISEWETAPLASFAAAIEVAHRGARAWVAALPEESLGRVAETPFGSFALGNFLILVGSVHPIGGHGEQLAAFTGAAFAPAP